MVGNKVCLIDLFVFAITLSLDKVAKFSVTFHFILFKDYLIEFNCVLPNIVKKIYIIWITT